MALQRVIATAGYILPTPKLETEEPHLLDDDIGAKLHDLSFGINPSPLPAAPAPYEHSCIDGNVTITPPVDIGHKVGLMSVGAPCPYSLSTAHRRSGLLPEQHRSG